MSLKLWLLPALALAFASPVLADEACHHPADFEREIITTLKADYPDVVQHSLTGMSAAIALQLFNAGAPPSSFEADDIEIAVTEQGGLNWVYLFKDNCYQHTFTVTPKLLEAMIGTSV